MNYHTALYTIISAMPFGENRGMTGSDLKDRMHEMTGHYPSPTEFQKLIDEMKARPELLFTSKPGKGYYRTKLPHNWKRKQDCIARQIQKRLNELQIIQSRI